MSHHGQETRTAHEAKARQGQVLMTHTDIVDTDTTAHAKRGRPMETPMQRASKLLSAIENADPNERFVWDQSVVRCIDMDPNDFLLGLRRLVRGQ